MISLDGDAGLGAHCSCLLSFEEWVQSSDGRHFEL